MSSILEFQKLDEQLIRLQKEISNNPDKRQAQDMKNFIMECQLKSASLERDAKVLVTELEKLKEVQAKGVSLVEKYSNQNIENMSANELKELVTKLNQAQKHLNELENRLRANIEKTKNVLQEFDNNKKRNTIARQKHADSKASFEQFYKTKEPKLNEIKQKMMEMQKSLDSNELSKYRSLRQDNIFPVYVPLVNGSRCGGCRMELPSNNLEKLKKIKKLECESCRRIIYID